MITERLDSQSPADKLDEQSDRECGLYEKFFVERTDGRSAPGQKHDGCEYYVLDLDHDKHAAVALEAYAASCEGEYPALAADLRAKALTVREEHGLSLQSAGTSIIGQSRNTDKLVMLVRWLVTHPGECIGDHPDVLAQAKLALASSRCPACGQDDKTVCYDARCPYEMRTPHSASERIEPKKDWGRAQVGLDGNCGYALLGADLQSGVAEFVEIEGWPQPTYKQERAAWGKALAKLEERLGSGPLRYEVIR